MEYNPSDSSTILGKGGFADVFRGTYNGSPVAIKRVLQTSASLDSEREREALTQLDHPNIINLLHEDEDINFRFYVLELCEASLDYYFIPDDHPKKYKGSIPSDKDAFIQLAEGLHYIHSKGLVHRDVKPGNVLISTNSSNKDDSVLLKWSDFGLCRPVNERGTYTASGIKGTMDWLAPEILMMMEDAPGGLIKRGTIKSDTFSAGAVFFYILSRGNHPFGKGFSIPSNICFNKDVNRIDLGSSWYGRKIILKMIDNEVDKRISLSKAIERLKSTQYSVSAKFIELKNLCEDHNHSHNNKEKVSDVKLDRIRRLVDQEATLGIPVNDGSSVLRAVCSMERLHEPSRERIVKKIVDNGESIDYMETLFSFITLRNLSESHLINIVTLFFEAGIDLKHPLGGNHLFVDLYIHSWVNSDILASITKFLIDRGLNLNETDRMGQTVLHQICQYGRDFNLVDRIRLLMNFGVPVNALDCKKRNALHCICSRSFSSEIVDGNQDKIQKEQAEITKNICDAIMYLSKNKVDLNGRDDQGITPLFCLYETGSFDRFPIETKHYVTKITQLLVNLGLDINATDIHGANVLHQVCREYERDNLAERIQILIDHGVKVDALDGKGWNALHYLCSRDKTFSEMKGGSFMEADSMLGKNEIDVFGNRVEIKSFVQAGVLLRKNGIGGGVHGIKPEGLSGHAFVVYCLFIDKIKCSSI